MKKAVKNVLALLLVFVMAVTVSMASPAGTNGVEAAGNTVSEKEKAYEEVLVPDEKYWEYEEIGDGEIQIISFDDYDDYDCNSNGDETKYQLVVPSTLNGKKVTIVGSGDIGHNGASTSASFLRTSRAISSLKIPEGVTGLREVGDYTLVSVELPSTLEYIGGYAFSWNEDYDNQLKEVTIPDSVTEIGYAAFRNCKNLKTIEIPEQCKYIEREAFYGCHALKSITIPASVRSIGEGAFADCRGLEAFEVEAGNTEYWAEDGVLCDKYISEVETNTGEVDEDGDPVYEYEDVEITRVISYPGAKKGEYTLEKNMDFEWTAFLNVKGLTALHAAEENESYASVDGVLYTKDMKGLCVCPAGKTGEYTVPEGVYYIQTNSFSNSSLSALHLPDSLCGKYEGDYEETQGFIGGYSFYECDSMETLSLGKNITEDICSYLDGMKNLQNLTVSEDNPYICVTGQALYDKEMKELLYFLPFVNGRFVIPDSVEKCTADSKKITELVLGKNYKVTVKDSYDYDEDGNGNEIKEYEYSYASGLPSLSSLQAYEVSPENEALVAYDGILYSKDMKTLYRCPEAKQGEIVIPEGVTTILGESFEDYDFWIQDVPTITIPASVTDIQEYHIGWFSVVKGYSGSAAEKYVADVKERNGESNITFVSLGTVSDAQTGGSSSSSGASRPKKVTLKKVKALGKGKVKVTWKKLSGVSGYQVQYARNKKFTKAKKSKRCSVNTVTLKSLKKGKTWYVRVRAYKKSGSGTTYGAWSGVKKVRVKR